LDGAAYSDGGHLARWLIEAYHQVFVQQSSIEIVISVHTVVLHTILPLTISYQLLKAGHRLLKTCVLSVVGLSPRPSDSAVEIALLASDEYAQLRSKWKKSHDNNIGVRDSSISKAILKAREEKERADIEVEGLRKTLEAYRILADIME